MQTPSLILALVVACLAVQGCLLFTGSVNQPPHIDLLPPSAPVARGEPVKIVANVSDPDGDLPHVEWSTSMDKCPQPFDPGQRPPTIYMSPTGTASFTFTFAAGDPETVCVWAMAVDSQGATAIATEEVSSQDRAPTAVIKVLAPTAQTSGGRYPLYSYFHLSAGDSTDPDGDKIVDPQWTLVGMPDVATSKLAPCPGPTPSAFMQCLDVGGFPGNYTIELTVSDGFTRSTPVSKTLVVDDDHPACVKDADPPPEVSPIVLDPSESRTFTIKSILDDGAPFPTPADGAHALPTFAWKVRRNAGAWQSIVGYEMINAFTLPGGNYATGDSVDVAVTISDGVTMHLQPACDPGCPAGCPQSAQWAVEYR